jgi:hypothetical protein
LFNAPYDVAKAVDVLVVPVLDPIRTMGTVFE